MCKMKKHHASPPDLNFAGLCLDRFFPACTGTPQMARRVVNEVPNEFANESILALVNLCSLDDLLLERSRDPPIDHVARALLVVGCHDETCIMWAKTRGEHTGAPWPPRRLQSLAPVYALQVDAGMQGLLLAWIRNLWDWRHHPVLRVANATVVAVSDRE